MIFDFFGGISWWIFMGCFSSKEDKSVSWSHRDGSGKRSLKVTGSRHELIISGLESKKLLPLVRKPKKTSSTRTARASQLPLAAVYLRSLNDVKGSGKLGLINRSPARIRGAHVTDSCETQAPAAELQHSTDPPLQELTLADDDDSVDDSVDDFSFFNSGLDIKQMIPSPERCREEKPQAVRTNTDKIQECRDREDLKSSGATKDLKSLRVASVRSSNEAPRQHQSIYSPNTYVTPRFGSYALSAT